MSNDRRLWLVIAGAVVLAGALSLAFADDVVEFVRIDYCLDHGGRWNYESSRCEFEPSRAPAGRVFHRR